MESIKEIIEKKKRGLGSASAETRRKVGKLGGNAFHKSRGGKRGVSKQSDKQRQIIRVTSYKL